MDIVKLIIVIFVVCISVVSAARKGTRRKKITKSKPSVIRSEQTADDSLDAVFSAEGQSALQNRANDTDNAEPYIQNDESAQSENDDIEQWRQAIINAEILKTKF